VIFIAPDFYELLPWLELEADKNEVQAYVTKKASWRGFCPSLILSSVLESPLVFQHLEQVDG
jgi:hypothetical protein